MHFYYFLGAALVALVLGRGAPTRVSPQQNMLAAVLSVSQVSVQNTDSQSVRHLFDISGISDPKAVAFSPDGNELWATSLLNKKSGVRVFDAHSGKNISSIVLEGGGGVEIVFSSDGSKVYVSQMETAKVFEIDSATKKILRSFDTKGNWTKILALSADGKTLFASNWISDNVSEIDLQAGVVRRLIPTVRTPRGVYPTRDGSFLYVAGFDGGEIQKINLKTLEKKILFKNSGAMRHIVADEGRGILFVSDMANSAIYRVYLKDDSVTEFARTDANPNTIALSQDKKVLIVSSRGKNATADNYSIPGPEWGSVLLFDASSGTILDAIVAGNQPTALDISRDMKYFAFSDFLDARIQMFELPSYEALVAAGGGSSATYKNKLKK